MIRLATKEDIPDLVRYGREFFDSTNYSEIIDFDEESLVSTLLHLIESEDGVILIGEINKEFSGMVGGLLYPFYFNTSHKTGQEVFWWVDKKFRGTSIGFRLMSSLEEWAYSRGAKSFSMVALESLSPEKVGNYYKKRGYTPSEHTYIRGL